MSSANCKRCNLLAVVACVDGDWREVLLSPSQRKQFENLLTQTFDGKPIPVSQEVLPLDVVFSEDRK